MDDTISSDTINNQLKYANSLTTVLDEVFKKFEEDQWPYVEFTKWFEERRFKLKIMEFDQIREAYQAGYVSHSTGDNPHVISNLSNKYYKETYGDNPFVDWASNNKHKK